jgi:hypothetical protein
MTTMSMRLGSWLTKVTGRGEQGVRNLFDEVMYTRDFERDAPISSRTDIIPLYRVPSISRLYEMGELKQKPTFSTSSARFNDIVCLLRSDITQVEVDVYVSLQLGPNLTNIITESLILQTLASRVWEILIVLSSKKPGLEWKKNTHSSKYVTRERLCLLEPMSYLLNTSCMLSHQKCIARIARICYEEYTETFSTKRSH